MGPKKAVFCRPHRLTTAIAVLTVLAISWAAITPRSIEASVGFDITPYAGVGIYDSDLRLKDAAVLGGRLGLYFIPHLGIEGNFDFSASETDSLEIGVDIMNYGGDLVFRILPYSNVVPFIFAGAGATRFDGNVGALIDTTRFTWDAGAGVLFKINRNVAIRVDARDNMLKLANATNDDLRHNLVFTGGFTLSFGGAFPDADGDGVPDFDDRCPDTPAGAIVDQHGCPIDSDNDGVPDGIDQCPNTPEGAVVDARGCPIDSDGDGVPDGIDQCPGTPAGAVVDARGCPIDSDGDGVPDGVDQCPNTPIGARVDERGCPLDSDGDGVYDGLDLCPNTPTGVRVDKDGCPIEISEIETLFLDTGLIRLDDINFETAKWNILPSSYALLDEVGNILIQWPQLRIEIGGHTDSRGSAEFNQSLSNNRAKSVLEYLTGKFPQIDTNQYTTKGYGESQPLVPNDGAANWAKNRRVEFKVLNKDVLEKEIERRYLLPKNE